MQVTRSAAVSIMPPHRKLSDGASPELTLSTDMPQVGSDGPKGDGGGVAQSGDSMKVFTSRVALAQYRLGQSVTLIWVAVP
jgi:hypothetical protein